MAKKYITKAYIDLLKDKGAKTGVFGTPPRVIRKGEKYRKALSMTQKFIYEEFWELAGKAAHKGQVDEKGRVYVQIADSAMAVACDCSPNTIKNNLIGKGKYNQLFALGLISIKKRKDRETSEYYVHVPVYEGFDEAFLTNDPTTPSMQKDMNEITAKRNKTTSTKREDDNKQLEEERKQDSTVDTAEFQHEKQELQKVVNDMPDGVEPQEATQEKLDSLIQALRIKVVNFHRNKRMEEVTFIIEKHLGKGKKVVDATLQDYFLLKKIMADLESAYYGELPNLQ